MSLCCAAGDLGGSWRWSRASGAARRNPATVGFHDVLLWTTIDAIIVPFPAAQVALRRSAQAWPRWISEQVPGVVEGLVPTFGDRTHLAQAFGACSLLASNRRTRALRSVANAIAGARGDQRIKAIARTVMDRHSPVPPSARTAGESTSWRRDACDGRGARLSRPITGLPGWLTALLHHAYGGSATSTALWPLRCSASRRSASAESDTSWRVVGSASQGRKLEARDRRSDSRTGFSARCRWHRPHPGGR